MARTFADVPALLLAKVAAAGYAEDECWIWPNAKNDMGYGQVVVDGKPRYVHILSHLAFIGPIPDKYEVDHRCHDPYACVGGPACPHRPCFNFRHLKAVTSAENSQRSTWRARTHCPQGHPYDEANTRISPLGRRSCKKCCVLRGVARKKAKAAARGPIPPKPECKNGHPFDEVNTYVDAKGHRHCRACNRDFMRQAHGYRGPVERCPRDHEYDEANTYIVPATGHRQCKTCNRLREAARRASQREAA